MYVHIKIRFLMTASDIRIDRQSIIAEVPHIFDFLCCLCTARAMANVYVVLGVSFVLRITCVPWNIRFPSSFNSGGSCRKCCQKEYIIFALFFFNFVFAIDLVLEQYILWTQNMRTQSIL